MRKTSDTGRADASGIQGGRLRLTEVYCIGARGRYPIQY
jgi:hypothetical protein